MPGAFQASPEFNYDSLATAEEIGFRGQDVLRWLAALAESDVPRAVDIHLIFDIHRRWFESTFPNDAGHPRTSMVLNRKSTAVEVPAIIPALVNACDNWSYRREHRTHNSDEDLIELIVAEANTLTVDVYDTHPFLDGNTRTTWHLRNYLLMLDGLRPLIDLADEDAYKSAWWSATAHDHQALDADRHQRAESPGSLTSEPKRAKLPPCAAHLNLRLRVGETGCGGRGYCAAGVTWAVSWAECRYDSAGQLEGAIRNASSPTSCGRVVSQ